MDSKMENHVPVLHGKKCTLGLVRKSQLETLLRWANDPEVTRFLMIRPPINEGIELEWIEGLGRNNANIVFGIYVNDGPFIGTMGFHQIDWVSRVATSGAMIGDKSYWGKGIGTDAKMALLKYAFDVLNLRKVCSSVIAYNGRSLAYLQKCGYKPEGNDNIRRAQFFRDGGYHDEHLLAVFRDDWHPRWEYYQTHGTTKGFVG